MSPQRVAGIGVRMGCPGYSQAHPTSTSFLSLYLIIKFSF
jgi:hypothetical protein